MPPEFTWPADFPDSCPPDDASEPSSRYWRLVSEDPPTGEDFLRPFETSRHWSATECQHHALSLWTDRERCAQLRRTYPKWRSHRVARVDLDARAGVVRQAGSDSQHYGWWVPSGVDPTSYCSVEENS